MVTLDSNTSGQFINIISNDCGRIENAFHWLPYIFIAPLHLAFVIKIMVSKIDRTFLSGLFFIAVALTIQSALGKVYDQMRRITSKKCDKRIDFLNEVFNGIKVIKMYCWEEPFKKIVERLRKKELSYQRNLFFLTAFNETIAQIQPLVTMCLNATVFIYFTNFPLLPSYIFIAMHYYNEINIIMGMLFINEVTLLIIANVSLKRIRVNYMT